MFRQSNLIQLATATVTALIIAGCDSTQIGSDLENSGLNVNTLSPQSGDVYCESIKVDISGTRLLGRTGQTNSTPTIPVDNPIPPGDYRIRLHYEDKTHPDQAEQSNEQWYAEFIDRSGNTVLTTPESQDLPSGDVVSYTDLNSQTLLEGAYSVRAVHAFQSDAYNSITPTMIELYPYCNVTNVDDKTDTNQPATLPVISLKGANPLEIYQYQPFNDPGATAYDVVDGDISSSITVGGDTVNENVPGTYYVTYDVENKTGRKADQVTRVVMVLVAEESVFFTLSE